MTFSNLTGIKFWVAFPGFDLMMLCSFIHFWIINTTQLQVQLFKMWFIYLFYRHEAYSLAQGCHFSNELHLAQRLVFLLLFFDTTLTAKGWQAVIFKYLRVCREINNMLHIFQSCWTWKINWVCLTSSLSMQGQWTEILVFLSQLQPILHYPASRSQVKQVGPA